MNISVNGEYRNVQTRTLAEIIDELGYGDARIATALDGSFIPVTQRSGLPVSEGSELEILAPMQGG